MADAYFTTEQCPSCGRHTDGLSERFTCTVCDTIWTSGISESIVTLGPPDTKVLSHPKRT
ncbi:MULTISPECIES: hypothetical protein [unclassified Streptomyces]|uniref:hypothetical protein n=1 Tax=Streptomyces sp. SYP-A7185 TaxID=3040076 RepID=UPI0038F60001